MKSTTSICTLIFLASMFLLSCSDTFEVDLSIEGQEDSQLKNSSQLEECVLPFGDHGDAGLHENVYGRILFKFDTKIIVYYDSQMTKRMLDPCNLPRHFKAGNKVRFSGIEKIPPPNVKLIAPIIRLTEIVKT